MDLIPGMPKPSSKSTKGWVDTFIPFKLGHVPPKVRSRDAEKDYRLNAVAYYAGTLYQENPHILDKRHFWHKDNRAFAKAVIEIMTGKSKSKASKAEQTEARRSARREVIALKKAELLQQSF